MRTCNRHFPGTDSKISDQMALDVANDEKAIIDAIALLRQNDASSLEAIGFLLGTDSAQISRHLKGTSSTTLTNYLRIARALGYRCKIVMERAETITASKGVLSDLRIGTHMVHTANKTRKQSIVGG
jgi:hypothetical protein